MKNNHTKNKKDIEKRFTPQILAGFAEKEHLFEQMYGRSIESGSENNYIFWDIFNNKKIYSNETIIAMRKACIEEDFIYAYYKTGLIPTEQNNKYLSEKDKKDFNKFRKEFNDIMNSEVKENEIHVLEYVHAANVHLEETYSNLNNYLQSTLGDFLRRHLESYNDFLDYQIKDEIDFLGFCCVKLIKDLRSIYLLLDVQLVENIYAVARSIFETYLHIVNIANDKDFFKKYILAGVNGSIYEFPKHSDGKINYSQLIFKREKTKNVSIKYMCEHSPYKSDRLMYDIFYRSACQFVHLDIMSAKSYFHGSEPFIEIDAGLVAAIVALTFGVLLVEQFSMIDKVKPEYRRDVQYLTGNLKQKLIDCYVLICFDKYNKNELFSSFIERLKENVLN